MTATPVKRGKPRGRFDIVCVFNDGAYIRITSHKTKSLSPAELVASLREYADYLANTVAGRTTPARPLA